MSNAMKLADSYDEIRNSVVMVKAVTGSGTSIGTGFLVHREGYIITALHVVDGAQRIEVVPEYWRHPIPAQLVKRNKDDMALLRIDFRGLDNNFKARFAPARVCPRHKHVSPGIDVGMVGYAWGWEGKDDSLFVFRRTVCLNVMHPGHGPGLYYYLDGTAIAGMSGGPVFDYHERQVVGVLVRIEPERFVDIGTAADVTSIPSPEHLSVALQSHYIHTAMESVGLDI